MIDIQVASLNHNTGSHIGASRVVEVDGWCSFTGSADSDSPVVVELHGLD